MKPFGPKSLYANRRLRRCHYGAGHGVHSTFAFRLIREVMASPYPYYADRSMQARYSALSPEKREEALDLEVGRLWFRLIARMAPSVVYYSLTKALSDAQYYGQTADSRIEHRISGRDLHLEDTHRPMLICDQVDEALIFVEHCPPENEAVVLILGIRQGKASYTAWRSFVSTAKRGIILDAYDCGIFINRNKHLSFYRAGY
ncbi:hypothetical protein [Porphyromonas sp.]|uniref:hypothetical protein n=1 Tax=Porphyromonas sp. TaxID=1924944 RepID=UPI0026DB9442|nr:hypothetical protein [Porphyromonas sp.]MDO4695532.1 hypothetical protein [Porphyromonas sp.]MDO4771866.1 hypothetical protein [Porphyromonas sp.]